MIDIKHIINNIEVYKQSIKDRFMSLNIDGLENLYKSRNLLIQELELLQQQRKKIASSTSLAKNNEKRQSLIEEGKEIKQQISMKEHTLEKKAHEMQEIALQIPNLYHKDAPIGKEEKNNLVIKTVGTPTTFDFEVKDHIQLGNKLDIIDFETAAEVTGAKFYYLKNEAVLLELALIRFGIDLLQAEGFDIYTTPDLAKIDIIAKLGFNPRGSESNIYTLEHDNLGLIGTSEITLGAYHANKILERSAFPINMAGVSHCYRKEAGAAGQYSKGLYRVHQFTKLEMFVFCLPEDSEFQHKRLLEIEEKIYQTLELPYRVVDTCTGDLGSPAYRKYDIEAWMPGRGDGEYGEVTSTSNCTDYQAKRLMIRTQDETHTRIFPHMLNGTAIATSRTIISILENFQQADASITIPRALVPYCGFDTINPK